LVSYSRASVNLESLQRGQVVVKLHSGSIMRVDCSLLA
jgi:hypothetical protein